MTVLETNPKYQNQKTPYKLRFKPLNLFSQIMFFGMNHI